VRRAGRGVAVCVAGALAWLALAPARAPAQTRGLDIPVLVQTVPALPGARFALDGRAFVADDHGLALTTVATPGTYTLEAPATVALGRARRARFALWSDGAARPRRRLAVTAFTHLDAGFDVAVRVTPTVVDADGEPLDDASALTLSDDTGAATTHAAGRPTWLTATRAEPARDGLGAADVTYRVERIDLGSAAVVGLPGRLSPRARPWTIAVRSEDVTVRATDALFGVGASGRATVFHPDGRRTRHRLRAGAVTLDALVPGTYSVTVDAGVAGATRRFSVPGPGRVSASVVTAADIGAVAVLLVAAAGLLWRLRRRGDVLTETKPAAEGVFEGGSMPRLFRGRKPRAARPPATSASAEPLVAPASEPVRGGSKPLEGLPTPPEALGTSPTRSAADESALTQRLRALQKDKETTEQRLNRAHAELRRLETEGETSRSRTQGIAAERDALRADGHALRAQLDDMRTERDALRDERDSLRHAVEATEERVHALRRDHEAAVSHLRTERDELTAALEALADEVDARAAEVEVARADAERSRRELDSLRREIESARRDSEVQRARGESERRELRAALEQLEREQDSAGDDLGEARKQVVPAGDIGRERDELRAERDDLRTERDELKSRLEHDGRLEERLKHALGQLARTDPGRAEVDALRAQVTRLRRDNARLEEALRSSGARPPEPPARAGLEVVARPAADRDLPAETPARPVVRLERGAPSDDRAATRDDAEPWWRALLDRVDKP
jgi:predicted  nucleic acid-binding Zn-ribbon protein